MMLTPAISAASADVGAVIAKLEAIDTLEEMQAERKNNIAINDEIYKIGNIEYVNTVMQNDEISN